MLFNSYIFIFAFLPIAFVIYFYLNTKGVSLAAKYWLILSSLFFYSWWNIVYLPLILVSIVTNYFLSQKMIDNPNKKKIFLLLGLLLNIGLLGYFKYMDFFIGNLNLLSGSNFELLHLALPLAISFYTLQQIAFLLDSYGGLVKERNFVDYSIFVTFFPQLIAGPIVHHKEMMPQFSAEKNKTINYDNISTGIYVFSIGLFKKVIIADTFAKWSTAGHNASELLNLFEAWATSLSYTFQLYFDFSGYTDMAIGIALLFNIKLPQNFNSPYRSTNVIEFWSRWHMTLTRFLTTYIYGPIVHAFGKFTFNRAMFATFMTMLVAGLWHGAAWTFVLFGALHGSAIVINHYWKKTNIKLNTFIAWFLTFNFLNLSFVIFRAESMENALNIFAGMFGFHGIMLPDSYSDSLLILQNLGIEFGTVFSHIHGKAQTLAYIVLALIFVLTLKNSTEIMKTFKPTKINLLLSILFLISSISMMSRVSEFLYFNF